MRLVMQASFVTCFHSARLDNLQQTLRFLTADHKEVVCESEIIMVCQDLLSVGIAQSLYDLCSSFKKCRLIQLELDEMRLPTMTNYGVKAAESEKIVVLESDRILPSQYFVRALNAVRPKVQVSTRTMKKLTEPYTDEQIRDGKMNFPFCWEGVVENRSPTNQIGMRNMWSGNTAFWREDFMEADMMDENYIGYGWADTDMCNKMKEIGVQDCWLDEVEYHLWHPPATYGTSDQKELFLSNGIRFCQKWNVPKPDWLIEEIAEHKKTKLFM